MSIAVDVSSETSVGAEDCSNGETFGVFGVFLTEDFTPLSYVNITRHATIAAATPTIAMMMLSHLTRITTGCGTWGFAGWGEELFIYCCNTDICDWQALFVVHCVNVLGNIP